MIDGSGEFAAIIVNPECAVFKRFERSADEPYTLVALAIPAEQGQQLVGAEVVTASVIDLDWDVLAGPQVF